MNAVMKFQIIIDYVITQSCITEIKILINIHTYTGHDFNSLFVCPVELIEKCFKIFNFEHTSVML